MQIALHPIRAVAKNIRLANLVPNILHPDSCSPSHTNPQAPLQQQYKSVKNLDNTPQHTADPSCLLQRNGYSIHLVNSLKQRIKASTLIKRMYASRGYQTEQTSVFGTKPNQYTFEARQSGRLIGTLTLAIDTGKGLLADTLYKTELDRFRQQGRTLCEVSKLAFNSETSSKEIFASMFHMVYIFAHYIHGVDDSFIEINPRHATFYKRMLGFRQIGELRTCPRVNAPAVLLHLNREYVEKQIVHLTGQTKHCIKNIYPYFLTKCQENEIVQYVQVLRSAPVLIPRSS